MIGSSRKPGITLVEMLVALSILSTILLPIGMFLVEYLRGSNELGDSHQVMNLLEEKMELVLTRPFSAIPIGSTEGKAVIFEGRSVIDLRPVDLGVQKVSFSLNVEVVPVEFSAIADPKTGRIERATVDDGMKRLTLRAVWGRKGERFLDLVAYKADL
ncbi:MAG: prepilin-type N-terminal cleavage/methylation domain-containing protein [Candidatus Riflebacteria bacterium]|nr:prepilin-type N-terminal cleavage/methylation domain-containing protein [Candidatus Riflebacteria bacterium]